MYAFSGFRLAVREASRIVLVLDVSDSMNATDVAPDRLSAAETAARAFLDELPPDFRVGLTTFASGAQSSPPTQVREDVVDAGEPHHVEGHRDRRRAHGGAGYDRGASVRDPGHAGGRPPPV